mmetsp:Transcript_2296/g.3768  ORF Transcript_2296/g.3768 Transcript_2296/m.3768 type:complete len:453 (+) Transcript_2296:230-1588(+)
MTPPTRSPCSRVLYVFNCHILLLFHVCCVFAGATHQQQPQPPSRWSVSSDAKRRLRYFQLQTSKSCCFSKSPSQRFFRRSFIASPKTAVQISASQPITATSLFFQRRWKIKRSFLHSECSSIPLSHYDAPAASSFDCHFYCLSRQMSGRRGGGALTSAMSAFATTEESSASSSVESNGKNLQEVGCNNNNNNSDDDNTDGHTQNKLVLIHTYNCTTASLMGLGMPPRQFATWVQYYLSNSSNDTLSSRTKSASSSATIEDIMNNVSTNEVHWENDWENHVNTLRQYWKDGKLLCEHTNLLNDRGGMSKFKNGKKQQMQQEGTETRGKLNGSDTEEIDDEEEQRMKYDHFRNLLGSYADRLVNIVEDELSDASFLPHSDDDSSNKVWKTRFGLLGWIENEYGAENTRALMASGLLVKSEREQLEVGAFQIHPWIAILRFFILSSSEFEILWSS